MQNSYDNLAEVLLARRKYDLVCIELSRFAIDELMHVCKFRYFGRGQNILELQMTSHK